MSLSYLDVLMLGILQGIAEWLPISSKSFNMLYMVGLSVQDPSLAYSMSIWIHIGSFPAPIVVFRRQITSALRSIRHPKTEGRRLFVFLIAGTAISGVIGVPLYYLTKETLTYLDVRNFMIVLGGLLLLTGLIDLLTRFKGSRREDSVNAKDSILIGAAQGLAALPGISRSGVTILAASWKGFTGEASASLSFMLEILAIPSMVFFDLMSGAAESGITAVQAVGVEGLLLSAVASFLTSIIMIRGLLALARRVRMGYFVIFIGLVAIALNAIL